MSEIIRAADVRRGDQIRFTDQLTVVIRAVQHQNRHPMHLFRLEFTEIMGIDAVVLPEDARVVRVKAAPPLRLYSVEVKERVIRYRVATLKVSATDPQAAYRKFCHHEHHEATWVEEPTEDTDGRDVEVIGPDGTNCWRED